ncbi:hypothetical protein L2E82_04625 [Cichorium intybus]|uniref:Uncharacterized protein n=1 Tax=Cichorium intybus TaxID=13427 RepID=A0ACB9H6W4_CICIN|nr:hypothetical protein L2E82_04625 [Cichorium intybus]
MGMDFSVFTEAVSGFGFADARPYMLANEPEVPEEVLSFWDFFLFGVPPLYCVSQINLKPRKTLKKQLRTLGGSLKSSSACLNSAFQSTAGSLGIEDWTL